MQKNRKATLITVFAAVVVVASAFYLSVLAATDDFTANNDITVTGVTFGSGTADLFIQNGSKATSWSFNGGSFTVTDPGTSFAVGSTDGTVESIIASTGGANVACGENSTPGTSVVSLPTTAGTYTITPSTTTACNNLCTALTGAATYNVFPTCGAASCSQGYTLSGSGASATCTSSGGGNGPAGGGGGGGSAVTTTTTSYSNGSLLRASDSDKVYLIDGGQKRWISSGEIFTANGYLWPNVQVVAASVLNGFATGSNVQMATTAVDTSSIPEGGLIRVAGGLDVYIVKYVGAKKFKRFILSPSVFTSYQHLKWSDVKEISQATADAFTVSELVRAVGDDKVYKLYPAGDIGEKRWVKTAEGFNRMGFDWDSIYEINSFDRNSYTTGLIIE